MLTRARITNPETTDSAVLAMVLGELQARGLIKLKPDGASNKTGEHQVMRSAEENLHLQRVVADAD